MNVNTKEKKMSQKKSPNLSSSANLTLEIEEAIKKIKFLSKDGNHRMLENMNKKAHLSLNTEYVCSRPSVKSVSSVEEAKFTFEKNPNKTPIYPMALSLISKSTDNTSLLVIDKLDLRPPTPIQMKHIDKNIYKKQYLKAHKNWLLKKDDLYLDRQERISLIGKIDKKTLDKMNKLYSSHFLIKSAYDDLVRVNYFPDGKCHILNNTDSEKIKIENKDCTDNLSQSIYQKGATVKRINIKESIPVSRYGQDVVYIGKEILENNSNVFEIELRDGHGLAYLGANIAVSSIDYLLGKRNKQNLRNKCVGNLIHNNFELVRKQMLEDYKYTQDKLLNNYLGNGAGSTSISAQLFNIKNSRKIGVFANLGDSEIFALVFKPGNLKSKILMLSETHNPDNNDEAQRILDTLGEKNFNEKACPIYGRGGVASSQYETVITCLNKNRVSHQNNTVWLLKDKVPIYDIEDGKVFKNLERAYAFSKGIGKFAKNNGYSLNFCAGFQSMRRSTLMTKKESTNGEINKVTGQLAQHLGNNFAATLNGNCQCTRSFHDVKEQQRGSIAIPYCSVYEFDPKDHVVLVANSDGFADMMYITQIAKVVENLYQISSNITAKEITEKLWEYMISETSKSGHSYRNNIPAWDDISLAIINSPPLY